MNRNKLLIIFILLAVILFSNILYSAQAIKPDISSTPTITPSKKIKIPVFQVPTDPSLCYGSICFPPRTTPESLNLISYNQKEVLDYTQTSVENKMNTAQTTGTYNIPVLLVKFSDMQAPPELTQEIYNQVFNSGSYLEGEGISVKEFYKKNSYDKLNVTFDVYDWREVPLSYASYVVDTHQLVIDTLNTFGTGQNQIDFTQYDNDNDGRLDGVIIVQAGFASQDNGPSYIRSQARIYKSTTNYNIQGLYYGNAAIIPSRHPPVKCYNWDVEFGYPQDCRTSIEISVHEFAHVLGLPDLYSLNYNGVQTGNGLGGHTVMALSMDTLQDHKRPVNFDAWSKFFFGWLEPIVIDSATQANIYSLATYDSVNKAYLLRNPDTMHSREYFLVVNRHISDNTLDKYLFGVNTPATVNVNGGLDILHVDEEYIDQTYLGPTAVNSVMYDPDGDYYDDEVSNPGIVIEQNILEGSYPHMRHYSDLYTNENFIYNPACDPSIYVGKFDNIERTDLSPECSVLRDTTSSSYLNINEDSGIRVHGITQGGYSTAAFLTIDDPLPLSAEITSPENNTTYGFQDPISFQSLVENNIGSKTCEWSHRKSGTSQYIVFSTSCTVTRTPSYLELEEDTYTIKLKVTDQLEREATDLVTINVVFSTTIYNYITSPVEGQTYIYNQSINFLSEYYNAQGDVECLWKYEDIVLSNQCDFSATPQELNLITLNFTSFAPQIILKQNTSFNKNPFLVKEPLFTRNNNSQTYYQGPFYREITLTTTDQDSSYTSSVLLKIGTDHR